MKVTGYMIRESLKQHELQRDTSSRSFNGTLKAFPSDKKDDPKSVVAQFLKSETAIAKLQVAQMRYNLGVHVEVQGEKMTLAEAIKRIGADARIEKMWRSASGPAPDRYGSQDDERDPTRERSLPTITVNESTKLASSAAKRAGAFRQAIAVGNAFELELKDLDTALFE
jgi:hypothetical protein